MENGSQENKQNKVLLIFFSMNAIDELYKKQVNKQGLEDRRKRLGEMLLKEKQEQEVSGLY